MLRESSLQTIALLVLCSTLAIRHAAGQEAADYFPTTTAVYLQVEHPDRLIEKLEQHPIAAQVAEMRQVKQAIRAPQFAIAFLVKGLIEEQIDQPILAAIKENISGGLNLGIDTETDGIAIVFKAKEEAKLKQFAGAVLDVVANGAKQRGEDVPFKKTEYRQAVAAKFDDLIVARFESWFVISNKNELAKNIVDRMHDNPTESLSQQDWFTHASANHGAVDAWAAINLAAFRDAGLAQELFSGKTDNPAAELILGGVFDALKNATWASGNLSLDEDLAITLSMPFNRDWANPARDFFFGSNLAGSAPAPVLSTGTLSTLVSYRDIAGWWLSKEELFEEGVIAQLAQADSQLSTIFSGMDFGQDVLGALKPGVEIVVAENQFDEDYVPDVKLPAFALVGKLENPERIQRKLKIAFQSVIGFANINLGMQGQPQLDLETETAGTAKICSAQYYYEDDTEEGLLLFNFSPTIAFQGPYLIVSSTKDLAVQLAESAAQSPTDTKIVSPPANTRFEIDLEVLRKVLNDNKESLITQNMLEEGNSRKEAEQAIDLLLDVGDLLREAKLDFVVQPDSMQLEFNLITQ